MSKLNDIVSTYQLYPLAVKQVRVELESCEKKVKIAEQKGSVGKDELNMLFMEILTRKERLKALASLPYEPTMDVNKSSRKALQDLFQALNGFCWVSRFGWIGQSKTPTREEIDPFSVSAVLYDGVRTEKVTEGNVETVQIRELELHNYGCRGTLPNSIGQLTFLTSLEMSFNIISGTIPTTLRALKSVKYIDLSSNCLEGTLSSAILPTLTHLVSLDLSCNQLTGELPDCFEELIHLEKVDLSGNGFTGVIPSSLGCLGRLQDLRLFRNMFSGAIPETFSRLNNLRFANLSQNRLSSGLAVFHHCQRLERLMLQHNHLTDDISPSIGQLKRLRILYLHNNYLNGFLPDEIGDLHRLQHLNLSSNQLRGCLPETIGELKQLETLLLHENLFVGPAPLSMKSLKKLRDFTLFKAYPAEFSMPSRAFSRRDFERIFVVGPATGINSMHWDYRDVYGRDKLPQDDQTVTLFSGTL